MAKLIHMPDGTIKTDKGVPVVVVEQNDYKEGKEKGEEI